MMRMSLVVLLSCLLATGYAAIVTPWTNCGECVMQTILWPTNTSYLVKMSDLSLYRSPDEGQTWVLEQTFVDEIYSFPSDPKSILLQITLGSFYRSTDGGDTWKKITTPPGTISGPIDLHPTMVGWILVTACDTSSCQVYYTQDFGQTWRNGPGSMANYFITWSRDPATPNTIFGVRLVRSTTSYSYNFGFTTDFGTTWVDVVPNTIGYVVTNHYVYVGVATSSYSARLYASSNRLDPGHTDVKKYYVAEFPTGNALPEQGYTFLDDTTRSEYLGVKQPSPGVTEWGTVYSSDFDGDIFSLTLNYVAEDDLNYDFDKFNGLAGIYLANAYPSATSTSRQTKFSFDNGGEWKLLKAPAVDYNNNPINCAYPECSLHLHGILAWAKGLAPPYYSSDNAIGLMIAVGNYGPSLLSDTTKSKTYFTRDAGITWIELYPEPTVYEFGDHGGILVFATINNPTNRVYFSLDEGATTTSFIFTDVSIYVDNIFTEPTGTGRKFVLIGHFNKTNYIFGLDFTDITIPLCTDNDYETWSPSNDDNANQNCFLGAKRTYLRRKQSSQCYNDRDTDHIVTDVPCPCAWEDYECDVGFTPSERDASDKFTCTKSSAGIPTCATGYRLIPDTQCTIVGGLDFLSKNCPGYSGSPTSSGLSSTTGENPAGGKHTGGVILVVLLFVVLFGTAAAVGVLYWKNDRFREFVQEKLNIQRSGPTYGRLNTEVDAPEDDADHSIGSD